MRNAACGIKKKVFLTPLGWTGAAASGSGIVRVVLPGANREAVERELNAPELNVPCSDCTADQILSEAAVLLRQYFSGACVRFDLPLDIDNYTDFQQAAWRAAAEIPYGENVSYGWIAMKMGNPKAARAVGRAMGANPVPILIP